MDAIPLIIVWAILGIVVLIYVVYRLATDSRSTEKKHALYPFVSNSGDGALPEKGDFLSWSGYGLVVLGLVGFLVNLYLEVMDRALPSYLMNLVGLSIFAGSALLGVAGWRRNKDQ